MKDYRNIYITFAIVIGFIMLVLTGTAKANEDWSIGYRYSYDADEAHKGKMRLFGKRKTSWGTMKVGWDRYVGNSPNFFRTGTYDGHSLDKTGIFFVEQEFKF
jgi:hypothetical protein